jgi:NADH dehydrogenase FAD-containing subunit
VSKLRHAPIEVTLVDRRNFHLFQPLTYQVATGALSPGEITYPLRAIFKRDRNVRVLLAEVADFDLKARELHLRPVSGVPAPERLGYDTLIVAGGSHYSYFGHEEWRAHAAEVKSLESALAVRSRLLAAFEAGIDGAGVTLESREGGKERIPSRAVVWAAGATASGLAGRLAELTGAERDRSGRVTVEPDLTLPGHPQVFAIGDMVRVRAPNGEPVALPGVAPVAMQQGRYAASVVRARQQGREHPAFRYRDKGNLATIGRAAAVADIKGVRLSGFLAWATWLVVHLWFLIGFQNRLLVLIRWSFSFATHGRGARLVTGPSTTSEQRAG